MQTPACPTLTRPTKASTARAGGQPALGETQVCAYAFAGLLAPAAAAPMPSKRRNAGRRGSAALCRPLACERAHIDARGPVAYAPVVHAPPAAPSAPLPVPAFKNVSLEMPAAVPALACAHAAPAFVSGRARPAVVRRMAVCCAETSILRARHALAAAAAAARAAAAAAAAVAAAAIASVAAAVAAVVAAAVAAAASASATAAAAAATADVALSDVHDVAAYVKLGATLRGANAGAFVTSSRATPAAENVRAAQSVPAAQSVAAARSIPAVDSALVPQTLLQSVPTTQSAPGASACIPSATATAFACGADGAATAPVGLRPRCRRQAAQQHTTCACRTAVRRHRQLRHRHAVAAAARPHTAAHPCRTATTGRPRTAAHPRRTAAAGSPRTAAHPCRTVAAGRPRTAARPRCIAARRITGCHRVVVVFFTKPRASDIRRRRNGVIAASSAPAHIRTHTCSRAPASFRPQPTRCMAWRRHERTRTCVHL
eukprot:173653-Chlamydomonas_euryale.AAC.3